MKFIFLMFSVLLTMSACKSMSERGTASVDPQVSTEESPQKKETPLDKYYQNLVKKMKTQVADRNQRRGDRCDDDETSCLKSACEKKSYDCSYKHNLEAVIGLCKGVDGSCVDDVCSQKAYDCSYKHNLETVITMCRDSNGSCVKDICKQGAYDCSYKHNLNSVVALCQPNTDGRCVRETCALGAYDCKYKHNIDQVVSMCSRR